MVESHELVRASRRDIPRLAELWAHAFPGERTVEQRVRQLEAGGVYGGIDDAWLLTRQDRLAGALRLYRLTQYLHGTRLPMMGVAAVAVAPAARRQGLGADLCRQALRLGRARGDVVSVLYPFRPSFYQRLGWGLVGILDSFLFRPRDLPAPASFGRVRLAGPADRVAVAEVYAQVASASHGLIERTSRIWEQHLAPEDRHLFMLERDERAAGYLLVRYGHSVTPTERALHIHELVAADDDAYRELLGWIALQADQWPLIRYDALPEERFDILLSDPRLPRFRSARTLWAPVAQRIRGPMLRVLDVPAALASRAGWPQVAPCSFTLRVVDRELPENEGPWQVVFDGRQVGCGPAGERSKVDLELPAAEFAQLYVGELGVTEAVRLGRAEAAVYGDRLATVDALFHTTRTLRLLDEF